MEFPEGNPGAVPVDLASNVGQFRALIGDLNYELYVPDEPGFGSFEKFSDAEIEGYLAAGGGSIPRAIGFSYLYLAGQAALESRSVADYDLKVDTTKRAADLRAIAQFWFDRADEDDDASGANDIFETFDMVGSRCRHELAEHPACCHRGIL